MLSWGDETDIELKAESPGIFRWAHPETHVLLEHVLTDAPYVRAVFVGTLMVSGSLGWSATAVMEPGVWLTVQTDPECRRVRVRFRRPRV